LGNYSPIGKLHWFKGAFCRSLPAGEWLRSFVLVRLQAGSYKFGVTKQYWPRVHRAPRADADSRTWRWARSTLRLSISG